MLASGRAMTGEVLLGDAMSKNSFLGGIESCPHLGLMRRYIHITSYQSNFRLQAMRLYWLLKAML